MPQSADDITPNSDSKPWNDSELAFVAADIHVTYRTPTTDRAALAALHPARRALMRLFDQAPTVPVHALQGVTLVGHQGESIGILGRNGSGKSTLLRVIAGLETPTSGKVYAHATPSLLGVNAALIPDLSGEKNIEIGCYAMGMTRHEMEAAVPQVVELAGIGDAIYRPMKTYSSGMGSRLRFAIAAAARPELLLIDEALGTGDAAFAERSSQTIASILENAGTIVLVSHAAQTIEEICTRAIWMSYGKIIGEGPGPEIAHDYRWWSWNVAQDNLDLADKLLAEYMEKWNPRAQILSLPSNFAQPSRHQSR